MWPGGATSKALIQFAFGLLNYRVEWRCPQDLGGLTFQNPQIN
jgi:hypothetical protein